jgi:hypothetical protein
MSDEKTQNTSQIHQWIMSLAITVVCCAVFFLFFAGYFLKTQERIIEIQVRGEMNEARIAALESNLLWMSNQQRQQVAAPAPHPPTSTTVAPPLVGAVPVAPPSVVPQAVVPQNVAPLDAVISNEPPLLLNTQGSAPLPVTNEGVGLIKPIKPLPHLEPKKK